MNDPSESLISYLMAVLRANEGLNFALALFIWPAVVLTLFGFIMSGGGASLRPVCVIAALMAPIAVSFVMIELVRARDPYAAGVDAPGLNMRDGHFVDREKLFGSDVPDDFIREAKTGLPGILDEAEAAEVGITRTGETILVAKFPDEDSARRGAATYHRAFQLRGVGGDETRGWRATRMQGDCLEMLRAGRHLFVWTGLTKDTAAARRAVTDIATNFPSLMPSERPPFLPGMQGLASFFAPTHVRVLGLLFMVALYTMVFFKGAAWASSSVPLAGKPAISARKLASRLQAINDLDVPFTITQGATQNEFIADWRYANAKWVDHARAHGLRRTFRIRLRLDEASHTVRATDYTSSFDWSAGRSGASLNWKAGTGIVFFQMEQSAVFGLQFDEQGRFKPDTTYSYRFNLNEMKSPLIAAITQGGWTWRPTVWQGPIWLRWLTE